MAFLWFLPALEYRTSDLLIYFSSYKCRDSHSTPDPLTAVTRVVQRSRCSWNSCFPLAQHRACSCRPAPSAGRISYSTFQLAATVTQTAISIRRCRIADVSLSEDLYWHLTVRLKAVKYDLHVTNSNRIVYCATPGWRSRYCISSVCPWTRLLAHAHQTLHLSMTTWQGSRQFEAWKETTRSPLKMLSGTNRHEHGCPFLMLISVLAG